MDVRAASQSVLLSHPGGTGTVESADSRNSSRAEADDNSPGDSSLSNSFVRVRPKWCLAVGISLGSWAWSCQTASANELVPTGSGCRGKFSNVTVIAVLHGGYITAWHLCPGMLQQQEKKLLNSSCYLSFPELQVFGLKSRGVNPAVLKCCKQCQGSAVSCWLQELVARWKEGRVQY